MANDRNGCHGNMGWYSHFDGNGRAKKTGLICVASFSVNKFSGMRSLDIFNLSFKNTLPLRHK